MDDALHPLRCAYGAEAPDEAPPVAPRPGEPGHAEWSLLAQTRIVLERWPVPAPDRGATEAVLAAATAATEGVRLDVLASAFPAAPALRPSAATVTTVEALAAAATLAAVRQVYGETDAAPAFAVPVAEAAVLAQSRTLLDDAPRAAGPSAEAIAAVLAGAEEATLARGAADDAVAAPHLAPLAAVYGLAAAAAADPVETAVLAGARDALTLLPRLRPEVAVLAAVAGRAAEAASPRVVARPTPATPPRAADRAPIAGAAHRRVGRTRVWASSAALVGALLVAVVLFPREAVAPVAETALAPATAPPTAGAPATETPPEAAPLVADAAPLTSDVPSGPAASEAPGGFPPPAPTAAPAPPRAAAAPAAQRPSLARTAAPRRTTAPTAEAASAEATAFAPVAARPSVPQAPDAGWDASGGLHTISLRLRALRQATAPGDWDEPAEAFGAPRAPVTMSAMPGLQSVRVGAAPARGRVRPDSSQTGD